MFCGYYKVTKNFANYQIFKDLYFVELTLNIYWEIPHALSNVYKQICELANSNATYVKFAMLENYMVAYGGISSSIFFRDYVETELESFLSHIVQEANMSYHAMINAITKVLKNKLQ